MGLVHRVPNSESRDVTGCEPADPDNTLTDRLNTLLNSSGPGYVLQLCPSTLYLISAPIAFASPQQEISTLGYPTGPERATLVVNGPVANGAGHTTAVDGTCADCSGVILRNIQINGTRLGAPPTAGGANIEMGGGNFDQVIEYVHSFDPRGWSCLHLAEGPFTCNNITVQYNDIGPSGSDSFQQWADGISVSCMNSFIRHNMINNPTDGGIVLFGSPGTLVENNTIWVETQTLLGGINMVDYDPWNGNYTGAIVRNNTIMGGFASGVAQGAETKGTNAEDTIIKIGIAIGPRTWFGDKYGSNVSQSGTVINNNFTGAFSYAIAIDSATNFTVEGNVLFGNTSFIGARGPNCTTSDTVPTPAAFVQDQNNVQQSTIQAGFQIIPDADSLTCVLPPDGGDYWPFGGNPSTSSQASPSSSSASAGASSSSGASSSGSKVGLIVGLVLGLISIAVVAWFVRKWALIKMERNKLYNASRDTSRYT